MDLGATGAAGKNPQNTQDQQKPIGDQVEFSTYPLSITRASTSSVYNEDALVTGITYME